MMVHSIIIIILLYYYKTVAAEAGARGSHGPHFLKVPILDPHSLPVKSVMYTAMDKFMLRFAK